MFRKYTAVDGALKNHIVAAVGPAFLSPLVDQLTNCGQVSVFTILQHLFSIYRVIDKIYLDENAVNMVGPYNPAEPLAQIIE